MEWCSLSPNTTEKSFQMKKPIKATNIKIKGEAIFKISQNSENNNEKK